MNSLQNKAATQLVQINKVETDTQTEIW